MKKKILIIEDNVNLTDNLKLYLMSLDYDVDVAYDGATGLEKVNEFKPDLIICDINVPNKDGFEILEEISKNNEGKTIPFIYLTARTDIQDFRKGMSLGADDYIFKPFSLDDLLKSIENRFKKVESLEKIAQENKDVEKFNNDDKFLFKFSNKMEYLSIGDIVYILSKPPYIQIKFNNTKISLIREALSVWENKLPENFIRINKSTIVNIDYVIKVENLNSNSYLLQIKNENNSFFVSRQYKNHIKKFFPNSK